MYHMNYFTIKRTFFLVYSNEVLEEFAKIDKFMLLLEKSGVGKILEKEANDKNNIKYSPYNLFATIIYCFTKYKSSLREMEELCKYDVRVSYIMEHQTPDYSQICLFINKYILPYQYEIFTMITKAIIDWFSLDISVQYLDGTKIQANANKYKFVWKPTTYHKKLDVKIRELLLEINIEITDKELIKSYTLNQLIKEYVSKENIDIDNIPSGKGKRLTKEQRIYKKLYQNLIKILEYEEK